MYEQVDKKRPQPRDRLLIVCLMIAMLLLGAATPPMFVAVNASYRYHRFVMDFSDDLVDARGVGGRIMLSDHGEKKVVTADTVSKVFLQLTENGFGQVLKTEPATEYVLLTLPDGATLTIWNTPQAPAIDDEDQTPRGVTVRYAPAEGKPFIYLQRELKFDDLASILRSGA